MICAGAHSWALCYGVGEVKCTLWDLTENRSGGASELARLGLAIMANVVAEASRVRA